MIGTVRQVGYKFVVPSTRALPDSEPLPAHGPDVRLPLRT
jgi:hypothetical protein